VGGLGAGCYSVIRYCHLSVLSLLVPVTLGACCCHFGWLSLWVPVTATLGTWRKDASVPGYYKCSHLLPCVCVWVGGWVVGGGIDCVLLHVVPFSPLTLPGAL
jgi:hypothetical protein